MEIMNKPAGDVRKRAEDARVRRTRRALGSALVELMRERDFGDISVQQVLDRASVGRATFYAHFRNKADLLLSDAERYFDALEADFLARPGSPRRVAPVAELFAHVADYRHFQEALERSNMREPVHDLLIGHLARIIQRRIQGMGDGLPTGARNATVPARLFAAALVEMMRWWLRRRPRPSPAEMDAHFHDVVWGGLARWRAL
jgi:AcrR family transcriptional regulator